MNDVAYVSRTATTHQQASSCRRCRLPVLCPRHTQEFTEARREREAHLLRTRPGTTSPESRGAA